MARVAGVNIPDKKQAWVSLTHIFGIGRTRALTICDQLGIEKTSLIGSLNEEDLEKLRNELRKVEKELQEYKINEVGKQQQQFVQ